MPLRFCFPLNNQTICIDIPVLIPNRPGPDPDPWIHGIDIAKEDLGQLTQLATIAGIVERLPTETQKLFAPTVQQALKAEERKLPGAALNWHHSGPGPDPAFTRR